MAPKGWLSVCMSVCLAGWGLFVDLMFFPHPNTYLTPQYVSLTTSKTNSAERPLPHRKDANFPAVGLLRDDLALAHHGFPLQGINNVCMQRDRWKERDLCVSSDVHCSIFAHKLTYMDGFLHLNGGIKIDANFEDSALCSAVSKAKGPFACRGLFFIILIFEWKEFANAKTYACLEPK